MDVVDPIALLRDDIFAEIGTAGLIGGILNMDDETLNTAIAFAKDDNCPAKLLKDIKGDIKYVYKIRAQAVCDVLRVLGDVTDMDPTALVEAKASFINSDGNITRDQIIGSLDEIKRDINQYKTSEEYRIAHPTFFKQIMNKVGNAISNVTSVADMSAMLVLKQITSILDSIDIPAAGAVGKGFIRSVTGETLAPSITVALQGAVGAASAMAVFKTPHALIPYIVTLINALLRVAAVGAAGTVLYSIGVCMQILVKALSQVYGDMATTLGEISNSISSFTTAVNNMDNVTALDIMKDAFFGINTILAAKLNSSIIDPAHLADNIVFPSEGASSSVFPSAGASLFGPSAGASIFGPSAGASNSGPSAGASNSGPSAGASNSGPSAGASSSVFPSAGAPAMDTTIEGGKRQSQKKQKKQQKKQKQQKKTQKQQKKLSKSKRAKKAKQSKKANKKH
jgi:hypothetical protein